MFYSSVKRHVRRGQSPNSHEAVQARRLAWSSPLSLALSRKERGFNDDTIEYTEAIMSEPTIAQKAPYAMELEPGTY